MTKITSEIHEKHWITLDLALDAVEQWWDARYPEDVFTGESGDKGVTEVIKIRRLVKKARLMLKEQGAVAE